MAPLIDQLSEEWEGSAKVGKIDVDAQPELASMFGVASIPTLVVMKGGKLVDHSVGLKAKHQIKQMLSV